VVSPTHDFNAILETLYNYQVDFIIVRGVCAVLHGAPATAFDLDFVHSQTQENLLSLRSALQELEVYYRGREEDMTLFGPLDLLGTMEAGWNYADLLPYSEEIEIGKLRLKVLSLEKLIEIKEETAFEKDKAVLPILRQTLSEKRKKGS